MMNKKINRDQEDRASINFNRPRWKSIQINVHCLIKYLDWIVIRVLSDFPPHDLQVSKQHRRHSDQPACCSVEQVSIQSVSIKIMSQSSRLEICTVYLVSSSPSITTIIQIIDHVWLGWLMMRGWNCCWWGATWEGVRSPETSWSRSERSSSRRQQASLLEPIL